MKDTLGLTQLVTKRQNIVCSLPCLLTNEDPERNDGMSDFLMVNGPEEKQHHMKGWKQGVSEQIHSKEA